MDPALFLVLAIGGSAIGITAAFGLHLQQKLLIEQLKMPGYILDGFNRSQAAKRKKRVPLDEMVFPIAEPGKRILFTREFTHRGSDT